MIDMTAALGTRDRLLDAGNELIYRQGYGATGVAQICAAASARKGSFYHYWPSKRDLVLSGLERSWAEHQKMVLGPAFAAPTLAEGLQAWGERLAAVHRRHKEGPRGHVRGCRFGNLALEVATIDHVLRDAVGGYLERMAQVIAEQVAAAVERGELPATDAALAGRCLVGHMEGLAVLAKVGDDPAILRRLGPDAALLLGLGAPAPSGLGAPASNGLGAPAPGGLGAPASGGQETVGPPP